MERIIQELITRTAYWWVKRELSELNERDPDSGIKMEVTELWPFIDSVNRSGQSNPCKEIRKKNSSYETLWSLELLNGAVILSNTY